MDGGGGDTFVCAVRILHEQVKNGQVIPEDLAGRDEHIGPCPFQTDIQEGGHIRFAQTGFPGVLLFIEAVHPLQKRKQFVVAEGRRYFFNERNIKRVFDIIHM